MNSKISRVHYYDVTLVLFVVALLVANISATKLAAIGPILTDGGVIAFPFVYMLGNIITEIYGYSYLRRATWIAFGVMALSALMFFGVQALPPAPEYTDQAAFEAVLGFFPRILLASLVAFLVGSFVNGYVLSRLKYHHHNRLLGGRLVLSTAAGGALDTILFALIAFGGILSAHDMAVFIVVGWAIKALAEIILLPLSYRVVRHYKAHEPAYRYNDHEDYSIFHLAIDDSSDQATGPETQKNSRR